MELLKKWEKTLDRNLSSVKKEFAGLKVENASLRCFRGNVDDKIEALEADVVSPHKAVADTAQQNVTNVAQSVDAAFSEH